MDVMVRGLTFGSVVHVKLGKTEASYVNFGVIFIVTAVHWDWITSTEYNMMLN